MREPLSSVLSRDGAALLEPLEAAREALPADGAEFGVDGNGFTVTLERALSVDELVIELKRDEAASFLPIVTNGSRAEQRNRRLVGHGHTFHGGARQVCF